MTIAPREYDFVGARARLEAKPKSAGRVSRPSDRISHPNQTCEQTDNLRGQT